MTSFDTISPIDGSVIATTNYSTDNEINNALKQKNAMQSFCLDERIALCQQFVSHFCHQKDTIAKDICLQIGRPLHQAFGEIAGVKERADYMISLAKKALADDYPIAGNPIFMRRYPLGKILVIAPWNYPFLTAINAVIPALLAGNDVILKHASQTPLAGKILRDCFCQAGFPDGAFQLLFLTHTQTEKVIDSGLIDFVTFTGSVDGGRAIKKAASKKFINTGLELGGKDAAIVLADCDVNNAVENLVDGAFFNAGQSCCGVERIYVADSLYKQFVDAYVEKVKQYRLGNPLEKETTLGPMAKTDSANFIRTQIKEAIEKGATALIDEKQFQYSEENTPYLAPQVLVDVNHQMATMREESFGPVVGIMPFYSEKEAVDLANDSLFGLTASVWTKDKNRALVIGDKLQVGTVFTNRCDYLNPALAWTGVKDTGMGISLSHLGFCQLTRVKSFSY